jgi:hypothetical protein
LCDFKINISTEQGRINFIQSRSDVFRRKFGEPAQIAKSFGKFLG